MTNLSAAEESAISQLLKRTQELIYLGKYDEAEFFFGEILKHKPGELTVPFQRGQMFMKQQEHEKALSQFLEVYAGAPHQLENLNNTAATYFVQKKYDEAISFYKKYLDIKPDTDFILAALAITYYRYGDLDNAIKYFRLGLELSPEMLEMHSNLLLAMVYAELVTPEQLAEEARRFGQSIARLYPEQTVFMNSRDKNRKLRIGYISPDFRDHPVPYFLEPLLRTHDREKFEVYAYSRTLHDNPVMERMKDSVDIWRDIRTMAFEESYNLIREDAIDILVDVAGHSGDNSLKIFAKRAAPVQVTWLGYPATTGVPTMDYRITDMYAEPPGMTEHLNTETLWRLPHIFCVYRPHENSPDAIDHPPFEDNGYITFGCFNNFLKVRDPVIIAWKEILAQVPQSRLLLEIEFIDQAKVRKEFEERMMRLGMPMEKIILEPRSKSNQFSLYNKIDIALDPFPCVGGTTSMDTLWMGVPFVTLAGDSFVSRMGVSILSNVGLPELITQNVGAYIKTAVELAMDMERLREMRKNLREKFANSPAMDQKSFTKDMEEAFRGMWHKYCHSSG